SGRREGRGSHRLARHRAHADRAPVRGRDAFRVLLPVAAHADGNGALAGHARVVGRPLSRGHGLLGLERIWSNHGGLRRVTVSLDDGNPPAPSAYAILMRAASSRPRSFTLCSRMTNFWIFPVTVMGNPSTNFT